MTPFNWNLFADIHFSSEESTDWKIEADQEETDEQDNDSEGITIDYQIG